jgi:general transcription factor 3C polypeptide 5 (transcription factor C subunit 1)
LRRKLQDNVGKYQVEAVGIIKHTHRFRALADFYWDMNRSDFAQRYALQVLPGDGIHPLQSCSVTPAVLTCG